MHKSFVARFLLFAIVVSLLSILGGVLLRFLGQWLPEGAQAVLGA